MTAPLQVRLPAGPLIALTDRHVNPDRSRNELSAVGMLAQWSGFPQSTIDRWAKRGVPFYQADRIALALGSHPAEVWGQAWWSASYDQSLLEGPLLRRVDRAVERRELVKGYASTERARVRGPHRCAVDGCCARQKAEVAA